MKNFPSYNMTKYSRISLKKKNPSSETTFHQTFQFSIQEYINKKILFLFKFTYEKYAYCGLHCMMFESHIGLAISDKKLFRLRWNKGKTWLFPTEFQLFRGKENSRNSIPNLSVEEKNARNSVEIEIEANFLNEILFLSILRKENCLPHNNNNRS
jgi:hypothetical protein